MIKIPDSVVANPKKPRDERPPPARPYVVKMSDGKRTWQIEIPVTSGTPSFQAAIPLDLGAAVQAAPSPPPTEADREIIESKKRAGERVVPADPKDASKTRSYLGTIARVKALYKRRQYELALVQLVELDRQYPDDERILEMKGSLYQKLGRPKEAREVWERVLSINPNNRAVASALERLLETTE